MARGTGLAVLVSRGASHLGYCTSIHRGDRLEEVMAALAHSLPLVKAQVSPDAPMGIGLRLAAEAAQALCDPAALSAFQAFLRDGDCYVFTLNGFPYGGFYRSPVKADVYRPDWRDPARVAYTMQLADLMHALFEPAGPSAGTSQVRTGSISTVPGGFRSDISSRKDVEAIADNLLRCAAHLHRGFETNGQVVSVALEPEPHCFLETTEEAVRFFEREVFGERSVKRFSALTGLSRHGAAAALPTYLGLCIDTCHAAVEFEDPDSLFAMLQAGHVQAKKIQLSAGLRIGGVDRAACERLRHFDDGVYLHQVVARRDTRLDRYLDLDAALDAWTPQDATSEWRVHFHVPIFEAELDGFASTRGFTEAVLKKHAASPLSAHLEVETYTWDVLPAALRMPTLEGSIARELQWAASQLDAADGATP